MIETMPVMVDRPSHSRLAPVLFWLLFSALAASSAIGTGYATLAWLGPRGSGAGLSAMLCVLPVAVVVAVLRRLWSSIWLAVLAGIAGPPIVFAVLCVICLSSR